MVYFWVMKCNVCKICNYEYEWDWKDDKKIAIKGDKGEFIEIEISAHYFVIDSEDYYNEKKITQIYACPNCGTLRMNDYDLGDIIYQREQKRIKENE